jgi:hypothetical protein
MNIACQDILTMWRLERCVWYTCYRKACMRKLNGRKANINSRSRDLRESGWRSTSPPPAY